MKKINRPIRITAIYGKHIESKELTKEAQEEMEEK